MSWSSAPNAKRGPALEAAEEKRMRGAISVAASVWLVATGRVVGEVLAFGDADLSLDHGSEHPLPTLFHLLLLNQTRC